VKLNKKEVAQNLRLFGCKRFGTMKKFAEALDMNPSTLHSGYLNARSLPGPVLLVKLINLGCNINWLLTSRGTPFSDSHDSKIFSTQTEKVSSSLEKNIFATQTKQKEITSIHP
jgi:hypothetical protein